MTQTNEYKTAMDYCRMWYLRRGNLPWWRFIARRKALMWASYWAEVSKELHKEQ